MTKIIAILTSLMIMVGCEKEVSSLQERNGVYYEINSEDGFTGKLVELYSDGQKMSEEYFKDGKREGIYTAWYENGQKKSERTYRYKGGIETAWYENGQKKNERNIRDGKEDGVFTFWYENGQKKIEGNYKDGKYDGLYTYWDENGEKKSEENYKDGELIRRQK
jgi:antitoxin component YwqK of YwqJK toxin-antitoxin module